MAQYLCSVVTELDEADAELVSTNGANLTRLGRGLLGSKSAPGLDEDE